MRLDRTLARILFPMFVLLGCAQDESTRQDPYDDEPVLEQTVDELTVALCAGPTDLPCSKGQYCNASGRGACPDQDQLGVCATRPQLCTHVVAPVCGCDGQTYGNRCLAAAAGVAVSSEGECKERCTSDRSCSSESFCEFPSGQCGGDGTCQPRSRLCPFLFKPVCGCDGTTYSNACTARSAGMSVEHDGACRPAGAFCGGIAGIPCEGGLRCVDDPSDDCDPKHGGSDCNGICVP